MIKIYKRSFKWFIFDWYYNFNSFFYCVKEIYYYVIGIIGYGRLKGVILVGDKYVFIEKIILNFEYLL